MYEDRVHVAAGAVDGAAARATIDAEIHEIANLGAALSACALLLVCDHCGDEERSVIAVVIVRGEPPERFVLCGLCYRELCDLALGDVS